MKLVLLVGAGVRGEIAGLRTEIADLRERVVRIETRLDTIIPPPAKSG